MREKPPSCKQPNIILEHGYCSLRIVTEETLNFLGPSERDTINLVSPP